jgi:hypothetical protein
LVPAGPSSPTTPEPTPDAGVPLVTPASLPSAFDLATAPPLFTTDDPLDEVVWAYLSDRFHLVDSLTVDPAVVRGTTATGHWRFGNPTEGTIAEGDVHLRQDGLAWSVVAMTTDGVDLSAVDRTGGRVTGAVSSSNINSLALDVLDVDGQPVPGAPLEGGEDIDGNRFGTAGGTNGNGAAPLLLDVPVAEAQVVHVRALLLGGSILGVAELALAPPAAADTELPDTQRSSVVEGTAANGDPWSVTTRRTRTGWCVRVEPGATRLCTGPQDADWAPDEAFLQVGPVARMGDEVLIWGVVNPAAATASTSWPAATVSAVPEVLGDAGQGPGRHLVALVPADATDVDLRLFRADGTELATVHFDRVLPVGG